MNQLAVSRNDFTNRLTGEVCLDNTSNTGALIQMSKLKLLTH